MMDTETLIEYADSHPCQLNRDDVESLERNYLAPSLREYNESDRPELTSDPRSWLDYAVKSINTAAILDNYFRDTIAVTDTDNIPNPKRGLLNEKVWRNLTESEDFSELFPEQYLDVYNRVREEINEIEREAEILEDSETQKEILSQAGEQNYISSSILSGANSSPDSLVDTAIGINEPESAKSSMWEHEEQLTYMGTPYRNIGALVNSIDPDSDDIIYDLGSGMGRVPLYGAAVTEAEFHGIEFEENRVEKSREAAQDLGLENVEFTSGDVKKADFSDADTLYLFNPFNEETMESVIDDIREISKSNSDLQIVSAGPCNDDFENRNWLEHVENVEETNKIQTRIYKVSN